MTSPRWWVLCGAAAELVALRRAIHWRLLVWVEPRVASGSPTRGRFAVAAILLPLLVAFSGVIQGIIEAPKVVGQYETFDRRTQAIEILDARGRWLGVVPAAMEPAVEGNVAGWPEHRALAVEKVPRGWLDILVALEDQHARGWRSWCGIDALAIGRAAVLGMLAQSRRGGSTLAMQLVRSMRHLPPGGDTSTRARIRRKLLEIRHGAMLACTLGGIENSQFQRLLARHLPLVQGTPDSRMGGVLYGLGISARVLFHKRVENLDLAEQAVLAAAVRRHVLLAPEDDALGIMLRNDRWEKVKARAGLGLRLAYGDENPWVLEALDRLAVMPGPRAWLAEDIARAMKGGPAEHFRWAANPEYLAATLLKGEIVTALGEVWTKFGAGYRGHVAGITLTVDAVDNLAFKRRVERSVATTEAKLGKRLSLPLVSHGKGGESAQIVLVEADAAGRILRHYLNSAEPVSLGLGWRRSENGGRALYPSDRHVGSVAKAALAVLLGTQDPAEARYCNQRTADGQIHNWNGDAGVADCNAGGAWYAVDDVFGQSLNLPLLWRLRAVSEGDLVGLARSAGLRIDAGAPPATALVLGMASASPMQLLAMMQAIGNGVLNRPALGLRPSIVASYRSLGDDGRVTSITTSIENVVDFEVYFAAGVTADFVRHTLSAPLKRGGTLATLASVGSDESLHLVKTGTTTGDAGIRDKWVIGMRETAAGPRSYVFLVGSANPLRPLGQQISGNQIADILTELWR